MKKFMVLVAMAFLAIGCAEKKVATDLGTTQQTAQEAKAAGQQKPGESAPALQQSQPTDIAAANRLKEEEAAKAAEAARAAEAAKAAEEAARAAAEAFKPEDIHFDFDKYNIRDDARDPLMKLSDYLMKNMNANVLIEGHCDERGTNEYNLALGDRRANATKDFLSAAGISTSRIKTLSLGEEKPQCMEKNETCWQLNRRSHFVTEAAKTN